MQISFIFYVAKKSEATAFKKQGRQPCRNQYILEKLEKLSKWELARGESEINACSTEHFYNCSYKVKKFEYIFARFYIKTWRDRERKCVCVCDV